MRKEKGQREPANLLYFLDKIYFYEVRGFNPSYFVTVYFFYASLYMYEILEKTQ